MKTHYDRNYFEWQKKAGEYGAQQDLWMYRQFIKNSDVVLDFGCGGGYMLDKIYCREKFGVDINQVARQEAKKKGINVFKDIKDLSISLQFDVIISHHTLEHVENPAEVLRILKKHLKKFGILICVVPIDDWRIEKKYVEGDVNKHLYTWTPLLMGNLFTRCGYKIKRTDIFSQTWLPLSRYYFSYVPKLIYYFLSGLWGRLILSRQIRIIAEKG